MNPGLTTSSREDQSYPSPIPSHLPTPLCAWVCEVTSVMSDSL